MPYQDLLEIGEPFFSKEEVARTLRISRNSAGVLCTRYVKKGLLTRLKRDVYARTETLRNLQEMDLFRIANFFQVPSYISLTTALSYHGMTTQVQRNVFESICIKRSKTFHRGGFVFRYIKIDPKLYAGFEREKGVFMASPAKAVMDCFYLASMGRYPLDVSSLDLSRLDSRAINQVMKIYPSRTVECFKSHYEKTR